MLQNRSIPDATVIPVLGYDDVDAAAAWLCEAFGFVERLRIGSHRAQLTAGSGAVVVTERPATAAGTSSAGDHSMLMRVADADAHCARATRAGARIVRPPADQPYGERQYTALDLGDHSWTFSQSIADVHPREWGGELRVGADT